MFDKSLWKQYFHYWPTWPCPTCGSVSIGIQKEKLLDEETEPSKRAHSHEAFEVEWVERRFATILKCQNRACGELVAASGNVSVEEDQNWDEDGDWHSTYVDYFEPKSFHPAPPIFAIPSETPKPVGEKLRKAFELIWSDCGAAANQLRTGIDCVLDDQGIARTTRSGGKRLQLSTHSRIEKFKGDPDAREYLMAIKWLGNAGSHSDENSIERDDLLDGLELFEAALDRLYVRSDEKFAKLAAEINKRKGKRKRKKNKRKA